MNYQEEYYKKQLEKQKESEKNMKIIHRAIIGWAIFAFSFLGICMILGI